MADLRERWDRLCRGRSVAARVAGELFDAIETMYATPARAYHNLSHIAACLRAADILVGHGPIDWRVELAIWMHDCIYEPLAHDNEERSAVVAADVARRLGASGDDVAIVRRLILATRHVAPGADSDEAVVIDADLSILGAPGPEYDAYAAAIREEYAAVPESQYRAGRRRFVEGMLARPAIFASERGRELWEQPARANLSRELQQRLT